MPEERALCIIFIEFPYQFATDHLRATKWVLQASKIHKLISTQYFLAMICSGFSPKGRQFYILPVANHLPEVELGFIETQAP